MDTFGKRCRVDLADLCPSESQALDFLHKNHICHGGRAVCINRTTREGVSEDRVGGASSNLSGGLGIPKNYLPPEVLLDLPDAVGPACDLWALGCTLFEIREQLPLFYMIYDSDELFKPTEIFDSGEDYKKGPKQSLVTPVPEQKLLADLLYKLFQYSLEKRISAEDVLKHEWFGL
ncbi:hypothetical protein FCULG_00007189 [Fusarium culmorum]|uniref:Protein kinase domain-containing protein n=1 Tax=Fusarium culmorum TaxID=5516 RepID=A0A2T4GSN0_FUSCU|nr:hypothetical protein FCULG_00007189 [Fusarium culmorum]